MDDSVHLVRICTGLSCRLAGAADHLRAVESRLGIARGGTTADGRLALEEADCLSACALAPVLEVDGVCHGRVTAAAVERLPRWYRTRRPWPVDVDAAHFPPVHAVGSTARARLADLHTQAEGRARRRPDFRFLVQGGSCGEALGAEDMIRALRLLAAMRGLDAEVLDGACHGMCWAGLTVEVQRTGWPPLTFTQLTSDAVPDLLSAVVGDKPPLARFAGVAWNGEGWRGLPPTALHPFFAAQRRSIMERCGHLHPVSLDDALLTGGYCALADVLDCQAPADVAEDLNTWGPGELRAAVAESGVGQHGTADPRYFVANAEEGAPGLFTDRHLVEGDPHRVLEGLLIAAYAVGARQAILYISGAARLPLQRMARALAKAEAAGLIGDRILGSAFSLHVEILRGARGFVRGQEGALGGEPTVISNLETLAAVPPMMSRGGGRASQGRSATRLLSVSGPVNCPGIVEVEPALTLRALLFEVAAGLRDRRPLRGVLVAGRSEVVLSPESLDVSLQFLDALAAGSRGVIAIPDSEAAP